MNAHRPPGTVALLLALSLAACQGSGTVQPTLSPSGVAYPAATATSDLTATPVITTKPADVPAGRILFHRLGSDGVERYFTVKTDGTDEHALYDDLRDNRIRKNLRLEQERVGFGWVMAALSRLA